MKLGKMTKLLPGAHGPVSPEYEDIEVTGVTHDSRRVKPGFAFVAIAGHQRDGAAFAEDALQRGAAAIVAERTLRLSRSTPQFVVPDARRALAALANSFFGRPSRRLQVVGVTGTNGKTTTTYMLRSILEASGARCGLLGTISYETGRRSVPASITTPESVDIQEYLAEMAAEGMDYAAMEVSSHSLCMRRVDFIQWSAAVFTNLTPEHMDYHRTISAYRDAKAQLFRMLGPAGYAVLNADDKSAEYMEEATFARVMKYGTQPGVDVRGEICQATLDGIEMTLESSAGRTEIRLPFIGAHNLHNALGAATAALALGLDLGCVRDGLQNAPPVPGRLEPVPCARGCKVLVDFAHTDQALRSVLESLRRLPHNRILVVFGAGGDRDRTKRPRMGRAVEEGADLAWVTSDNPRTEDPLNIIEEILSGVSSRRNLRVEPDRQAAITEAIRAAEPGDLVLIAGKGHECTQRFKDTVIPFDDREAVKKALADAPKIAG